MFELFYTIAFVCLIFIIMVNTFLLAVVVSAYEGIQEAIKDTNVEKNVFLDVYYSFMYKYFQSSPLWKFPNRMDVVSALAAKDFDKDCREDSLEEAKYEVTVAALSDLKNLHTQENLFADRENAEDWMEYYIWITPVVEFGQIEAPEPVLPHQQEEAHITKLAWITAHNNNAAKADPFSSSSNGGNSLSLRSERTDEGSPRGLPDGPLVWNQKSLTFVRESTQSLDPVQRSSTQDTVESLSRRLAGVEITLIELKQSNLEVLSGQDELRQLLLKLQSSNDFITNINHVV
jgi:hypothetical protein